MSPLREVPLDRLEATDPMAESVDDVPDQDGDDKRYQQRFRNPQECDDCGYYD